MAKSYDYQSAFDIIGPVMMGPSSSHTAGAVKIGNAAREILGDIPKKLEIHYYESFAKTHQGHGTDVAIVGGAMGYSTFDNRIKSALDIAADEHIAIDIIEEDGDSIGQHPNCAYLKSTREDGRYIEVIGISIGGGTIKIKGIHINGLSVDLNHGLPILVFDGAITKSQTNHLINHINDLKIDYREELVKTNEDNSLVVLPLNKAISESTLDQLQDKYSNLTVSYIN
ncbi:L-serine ammonia-lyase, iron-sulfur-dependent subunit beta [Staphylococcus simiae]|uniref:L-serine deaminase n=1 Tax=Staphylococcus simiae CCM 7213 = CCUG 51256 TaxID=911238 RepID=G5JI38_9STAP|nr:L-serine ammonia-lyase, iron-sulfur-dependent subunit beta [Staphylococcus simiae]EHJ08155.1 L-serine dehydratase, iron-sulfur-dependent, beta subunit [Staphylococcus simiae CCM 7213 = CCUG 51256]PNZ14782.1 L-serine ammonia-lyase, iron-sulfur-dependent, subunit beta [Staphylococcus simiae]SNV82247.1 L-serine dehydratase, beta subunit [Staphylococcus simiae]